MFLGFLLQMNPTRVEHVYIFPQISLHCKLLETAPKHFPPDPTTNFWFVYPAATCISLGSELAGTTAGAWVRRENLLFG